ncbi:hypothetical protein BDN72DRAFT_837471, partial [Pluteus cervinus]
MMNRKLPLVAPPIPPLCSLNFFSLFCIILRIVIYNPLLPIQCTYLAFLLTMNL